MRFFFLPHGLLRILKPKISGVAVLSAGRFFCLQAFLSDSSIFDFNILEKASFLWIMF